ncbi:MAG: LysM peptidoglycan-binding domain-containing protein [Candidatus Parcubacteria bacterium]|nr:LysM peptidoglycan-binding domain-containing protein [Burkholderiales bacterium]
MKSGAPERYVVVPGDTLWSIAGRFTDSPWRWPELWNLNREDLKNPHRIYPGDVIVLDRARGRLAMSSDTVRLSPRVRAESTAQTAIPSISPAIIEPFLTRPLVIEPDGLDNAPTIVAAEESRVILESGNRAFVRGIGDSKETIWFVYRRGSPLVDPDTKTTLGFEAIYLGTARVVRSGEPAIIQLSSVTQEVGIGDKLVPAGRPEVPTYAPRAPVNPVNGRIVSLYGGGTQLGEAGAQSIIAINRGRSQGMEVGHVVALYRPGGTVADGSRSRKSLGGPLTLPDERYGVAFVFRVFDRVSYALVMNITKPVNKLDLVQNP